MTARATAVASRGTPGQWAERAACRGRRTAMFFPATDDASAAGNAKHICAGCPVRESCLEFALATDQPGVWGGLSEKERRRIRRQRSVV